MVVDSNPVAVPVLQITRLFRACLKHLRDMIRTCSQMHRTDKYELKLLFLLKKPFFFSEIISFAGTFSLRGKSENSDRGIQGNRNSLN